MALLSEMKLVGLCVIVDWNNVASLHADAMPEYGDS